MKHAMRSLLTLVVLCATPALLGQRMGGAGHLGGGLGHGGSGFAHGGSGRGGFGHGGFGFHGKPFRGVIGGYPLYGRGHGFYNSSFYSPYWNGGMYWWDDDSYSGDGQQVVVQQPPAPVVVQAASASQPVQEVKPPSPLLIELQGDRFVRLTGSDVNPPRAASATAPVTAAQQHNELPPAVLIFRDGHRQEVASYSIIGPALYAAGSYWTNGYWTQKILLADLNLPATFEANQQRGVNFVLPSAPDQVITRP
ncbi:MAG: hypothetical protein ACM3PW_16765 [Chlamydiota bacterium]